MSIQESCAINPEITIDIEKVSKDGTPLVSIIIDGKVCHLKTDAADRIAEGIQKAAKSLNSKEAEDIIEEPEYWQDYLLEAKHVNVSHSRVLIEGEVWVVNHDNIREYIQDYTMDNYSQFCDNLHEMHSNGLISKES